MLTGKEILDLPMHTCNEAGAETVRGYLKALLEKLWIEGEGFSGKRPFGNSGWEYDFHAALARAGVLNGVVDEYGACDLLPGEEDKVHWIILSAIDALN